MDLRAVAEEAARAGGAIVRRYFGRSVVFERKVDNTLVSIVDRESEEAIRTIIKRNFPTHAINGEEGGRTGDAGTVWHVDPLDGTTNFSHRIPLCAVSIGVESDGAFIIGVIYDPFRDELFSAQLGAGATCNGVPIRVSGSSLRGGVSVLDASFKGDRAIRKGRYLSALLALGAKPQMIGSNALQLAEVACGRCVSSLSDAVHAYDFAAGIVLVREAGGVISDQDGTGPTSDSVCVIAANDATAHSELLKIVKREYAGYQGM